MKKHGMIRTILTLMMALAICVILVPAEAALENETFTFNSTGVKMEVPAGYSATKGIVEASYDFDLDNGVSIAGLTYFAIPVEKYKELSTKQGLTDEEIRYVNDRIADILWVFSIDGGRTADDVNDVLMQTNGIRAQSLQEIGTAGDYRFFLQAGPDMDTAEGFEPEYREEYMQLVKLCEEPDWIKVSEPIDPLAEVIGSAVAFETTDLAGNPVNSAELFGQYRLTMVNLWGTFCGPCIQEMPGLETLYQTMKAKNVNVIGVVVDISGPNDKGLIEEAEDIISTTGVKYMNLLPWNGIDAALPATAIPTTYFVDSQGQLVGRPAVGSRSAAAYEGLIDSVLAHMGK